MKTKPNYFISLQINKMRENPNSQEGIDTSGAEIMKRARNKVAGVLMTVSTIFGGTAITTYSGCEQDDPIEVVEEELTFTINAPLGENYAIINLSGKLPTAGTPILGTVTRDGAIEGKISEGDFSIKDGKTEYKLNFPISMFKPGDVLKISIGEVSKTVTL